MRHRITTGSVIFIFFIIILTIIVSGVSGEGEACHDCHGTDGGYTFKHLWIYSSTARVVDPGSEFEHIIILEHPGDYEASSITVKLDLSSAPDLTAIGQKEIQLDDMAEGKRTITFVLNAKESYQSQRIRTIVTYISNYHYDPTEYTEVLDISVTVDKALLLPSTWSLDLEKNDHDTISFEALERVSNINVLPSSSLDEIVELDYQPLTSINQGESFSIDINAKGTGSGKLNIVYEDEIGQPHKLTLDISISKEIESRGDFWVIIGMVGGFLSWILLFFSTVIGAPIKKFKPILNKVCGSAVVRKELHCWVCYILLILALFHGVVVMVNHWYGVMVGNTFLIADFNMDYGIYINLGTVSWFLMILVSVTGIFWKTIIKVLKYKTWRWTHNVLTLLALVVSITHGAIMTHFRFF